MSKTDTMQPSDLSECCMASSSRNTKTKNLSRIEVQWHICKINMHAGINQHRIFVRTSRWMTMRQTWQEIMSVCGQKSQEPTLWATGISALYALVHTHPAQNTVSVCYCASMRTISHTKTKGGNTSRGQHTFFRDIEEMKVEQATPNKHTQHTPLFLD